MKIKFLSLASSTLLQQNNNNDDEKQNNKRAQIVPSVPIDAADENDEYDETKDENEIQILEATIDQEWIDLIEKDDKYWDTCRGREHCAKLLLSNKAETITNDIRYILWEKFIDVNEKVSELPPNCFNLFLEKNCDRWSHGIEANGDTIYMHDNISQILLDVPRSALGIGDSNTTIRSVADEHAVMISRTKLFNVLYALSMYYPQIGYCQGMSYICALILRVIDSEDEAFAFMITLMEKYNLLTLFTPQFPMLLKITHVFEYLMKRRHFKLWSHLEKMNITSNLYVTKWFLTLFCLNFPEEFALRVWDMFLINGWKSIYQIALSLCKFHEQKLLESKGMDTILYILQEIPNSMDLEENRQIVFQSCPKMFSYSDILTAEKTFRLSKSSNS